MSDPGRKQTGSGADRSPHALAIDRLESALHVLFGSLKQSRLHEFLLAEAHVDVDRAGIALLHVLFVEERSLRLTELSEQLHIDAPAVTRKAQQLERAGFVARSPDKDDGRATRLVLTASGRRIINKIHAARRTWLNTLLEDWPSEEQEELARLLHRFSRAVDQHLGELDA